MKNTSSETLNTNDTEKNSNGFLVKAGVIVLILFSIHFWDLEGIPFMTPMIYNLITWLFCGFSLIIMFNRKGLRFRNAIFLFLFGILANCLASYINLGQDFYTSIMSFNFYYSILLYFTFHYLKPDRKFVENTIIVFAILYAIIFMYQYEVYPKEIFNESAKTAAYSLQFEILGHGFLMLGYFLLLNRFLNNYRPLSIILAIAFFLVLMKSDFRTLIGGCILITILLIVKHLRFNALDFLMVFVIVVFFIGLSQYRGVANTLNKMVTQTESNIEEGDKYVRRIQLDFYYKVYPRNFTYYVIGGGKPAGQSLYTMESNWDMNYNFVWVDIGLLGFFMVVGAITTAGLLWYTLKAGFIKMPRDLLYLNFYFLYLFIVSFTNEEIFDDGIFTVQALALYLIDIGLDANSTQLNSRASSGQ